MIYILLFKEVDMWYCVLVSRSHAVGQKIVFPCPPAHKWTHSLPHDIVFFCPVTYRWPKRFYADHHLEPGIFVFNFWVTLARLFHAPQIRRGGDLRSRCASCSVLVCMYMAKTVNTLHPNLLVIYIPAGTRRNLASLWRPNDVATSFRRHTYVIIADCWLVFVYILETQT